MASCFLPSFLSGWELPSISAAYSLSSSLQRRIISYLLKRTLGHLVLGGQLDLDQIQSGLGSGKVELKNVQLDTEAINRLLPSLPLRLKRGQIGSVQVQLPLPNLWNGNLGLNLSGITVELEQAEASQTPLDASTLQEALASSFLSAASEILDNDDEGRAIEASIHQSLIIDEEIGQLDAHEKGEVEAGSIISTFVESLLARLKVSLSDIRIDLAVGSIFTLKIAKVDVESKAPGPLADVFASGELSDGTASADTTTDEVVRVATVVGVEMLVTPGPPSPSSSEEGSSTNSSDEDVEMERGPARSLCPESPTNRTVPGGFTQHVDMSASLVSEVASSMYESAINEGSRARSPSPAENKATEEIDATETQAVHRLGSLLFSVGAEPLTLTLKTRKEKRAGTDLSRPKLVRVVRSSIGVEVTMGHLAVVVHSAQICALLKAVELLTVSQRSSSAPSTKDRTATPAEPLANRKATQLDLQIVIKSLNVIFLYEDVDGLAGAEREAVLESIRMFWARPSRSHPDVGHVRFKLDGLRAAYRATTGSRPAAPSVTLAVADLGVFEHLSPSLVDILDPGAPRVLPILVLDHNLAAEPSTPTRGLGLATNASSRKNGLPLQGARVETMDWRSSPHAGQQASTAVQPSAGRGARFAGSDDCRPSPAHSSNPYSKTIYGERGWKLRPSHQRHSSSASTDSFDGRSPSPHAIDVAVVLQTGEIGQLIRATVAPVHIFLDVSLVTRILPSIKFVADSLHASRDDLSTTMDLTSSTATLSANDPTHAQRRGLLEDFGEDETKNRASTLSVVTEAVRLELRVPRCNLGREESIDAQRLREERAFGLETRSGIFVFEAKHFEAAFGPEACETGRSHGVRFAPGPTSNYFGRHSRSTGKVSIAQVGALHRGVGQGFTNAFGFIGSIVDAETNILDHSEPPLVPTVNFLEVEGSGATASALQPAMKSQLECRLPSIHVCLDKQTIDAMQFLADDLTQWPAQWTKMHLKDSQGLDGEGLRILGSRFFGTRAGLSVTSTSTDSTATVRKSTSVAAMSLAMSEAVIRLKLSGTGDDDVREERHSPGRRARELRLQGSEIVCRVETDRSPNSSLVAASVLTFSLSCVGGGHGGDDGAHEAESDARLIGRTAEPGLTRNVRPMLSLNIESFSEPGTSYHESSIDVALSFVTIRPPMGTQLFDELRALLKAPEGVFEHVEPNEVTRLALKVRDCSLVVSVPGHTARAALSLGDVSVKTKITPHAPKTTVKIAAADINLFTIDDVTKAEPVGSHSIRSAAEHWNSLRYARVLALSECKARVALNALTRPDVDVKVAKLRSRCYICADTLAVMADLVSAVGAAFAKAPKAEHGASVGSEQINDGSASSTEADRSVDEAGMDNILDGLDEDAFRRAPTMDSVADLVDDDVPSDPSFLGETATRYHPEIVETLLDGSEFLGGDSIASLSIAPVDSGNVIFADEDVTIRVLDPNGIQPVPEYFTDPELTARSHTAFESFASSVRVRITNFEFSLRLHGGYDWLSTRQVIEDEARKVKRRLQKIKQLLSEGQTPDDSVEAATSDLLDSVHIALGQDPAEMDPMEMIKAMDEGLDDQSETTSVSDAGTWQPVPGLGGGSGSGGGAPACEPRKRHKLQRSRQSMIDFNFRGVEVEFDQLDAVERHLSSRVAVTADTFEIIDNIKTSTWHAFLTRMQDKEAAFRRDSEARMVRVEVLNLRAKNGVAGDKELRMRAKIEPLRLHVDQDALDFLKRFFAFKLPNAPKAEAPTSLPAKPFIQYAEIYPVKLKLDYKPKRVDYGLLKEGKTIELMNFFHFEGAKMTLRHITLRGINGWPRLFENFNDIWTPDVKANQLADVLAGVAPIRTLVNVGSGVADLVLLPIEQYQKDKRLIRGVQRGATSFAKTTALEAVRLGARLATGTQVILEQAEHILGGGRLSQPLHVEAVGPSRRAGRSNASSSSSSRHASSTMEDSTSSLFNSSHLSFSNLSEADDHQYSRYASQPEDMKDALAQAYAGLSKGLTSAAQTILAVPMEVYEGGSAAAAAGGGGGGGGAGGSGGDGSVARPVVKAVPIAVLRGARGATEAFAKTLMGVQAQLGEGEDNKEGKYKTSGAEGARRR